VSPYHRGAIVVAFALLWLDPALAQQSTLYGTDGRVVGRSVTDSQGTTTHYDAAGRRVGTATTGRDGTVTVTVYGAAGRRVGTSTSPGSKR
jgi:YD repeat-containing protein